MFTRLIRTVLLLLALVAPGIALSQTNESEAADQKKSYKVAMAELKAAKDGDERFYALDDAAKESFRQNREADARSFAEELERLAPKYKGNWNYGNAVQDFNLVFGLLALKKGDVEAAKARLLAAGRSPGSPQMDSFGPNMSLAKALLEKGEKKVVLEYFELCAKFWKTHLSDLDLWKRDVEEGRVPDFGANLDY